VHTAAQAKRRCPDKSLWVADFGVTVLRTLGSEVRLGSGVDSGAVRSELLC